MPAPAADTFVCPKTSMSVWAGYAYRKDEMPNYKTRLKKQSRLADPKRFKKASSQAQSMGMSFMPTKGIREPTQLDPAAKKEFGRSPSPRAQMERRKRLAASLQGRTTDSSRKRALARLMAQYGIAAK